MRFPSGLAAHMHLSWLDPHKERRFTIVGSRRMATFDDMEHERKLTIFDKGFDGKGDMWGEYITRSGDIFSPQVPNAEPLRLECEHFLDCVRSGGQPVSDDESGLRVVRVLEGLQSELEAEAPGSPCGRRRRRGGRALRVAHTLATFAAASATAATTRSCCSSVMCANIGSVTVRDEYASVIGSFGAPSR